MSPRSIGIIGGGRVTRILLGGLTRAAARPAECVVSDTEASVLEALESEFPFITTAGDRLEAPAGREIVFGALHPPALKEALPRIGANLAPEGLFVSLAPAIRIPALTAALGGFERVARMIPNAPSIVGSGFNPIAFAPEVEQGAKRLLREWLAVLGKCPEVPDEQLEAYAILTAMGPTYFWYQFEALRKLGKEFGLDDATVQHALPSMLEGGVKTFFDSGLSPDQVIDLVPVKPLESLERTVEDAYENRLRGLYGKLTGHPAEVGTSR